VKLTVEREALGEAVSFVARALPSRPVVPVLAGMLVHADDTGLTLSCFDYEVSARVVVPADVGEPGTALVPGRLLAEITKSLPAAQVEIASAADMVTLTCDSVEFALVSLDLGEYPGMPDLPDPVGTTDGGQLAMAAAQVVPSASRDDTLPMLTGVCLEFDAAAITLAATDRYRLAVATIGWVPASDGIQASVLVPAKTLADIAKAVGPGTEVAIALGQPADGTGRAADGIIGFEGGGRRLTARLIGTQFVKYQSRFPAAFGCHAEVADGPFTDAVRRVALVADRASPVQLAFRPDTVVIEARSAGRARAVESVPCEFTGDQEVISFDPRFLLDGLAAAALSGHGPDAADAHGRIAVDFTSPAKPAMITWAGPEVAFEGKDAVRGRPRDTDAGAAPAGRKAEFRYLVVPLRVPEPG
jgi:DNA polymerase III subunit beta